jgi:phage terminase large subunit-like protein
VVILVALLQLANATIVGHVYNLVAVPTLYTSKTAVNGGIGVIFRIFGIMPDGVRQAANAYTTWSNVLMPEPMPDQRLFIMDRAKFAVIGNFTARAVRAQLNINCYPKAMNLSHEGENDSVFEVGSSVPPYDFPIRLQPQLALWPDAVTHTNSTQGSVTMMFAAINGTIEGGYQNEVTESMAESGYLSISTLACDIAVNLVNDLFCTAPGAGICENVNTTISTVEGLMDRGGTVMLANWLAASPLWYGPNILGALPLYAPGKDNGNSSVPLPFAFSTGSGDWANTSYNWTQPVLTNFIEVCLGALAMTFSRAWADDKAPAIIYSESMMKRPDRGSAWIMLCPPSAVLAGIVVLMLLAPLSHRKAGVHRMRLASTSEIIYVSQTTHIQSMVDEVRNTNTNAAIGALGRQRVRYGIVAEGFDGLGRKDQVRCFQRE